MSALHRIFYVSRCQTDFLGVDAIVQTARRANALSQVTGTLLYTGGHFAQWLEGEAEVVDALVARIAQDIRHGNMALLSREAIVVRRFAQWSMGFEERIGADDLLAELIHESAIPPDRAERLLEQLVAPS